jgi:coenzyme F420-reducing hydrogenase delta subunit
MNTISQGSVLETRGVGQTVRHKPVVSVFYCLKALSPAAAAALGDSPGAEVRPVRLPCSSMVKDVFLLRAFEAGADGVVVMVCPRGECRFIEGNRRAQKRVERVQKMLDSLGLGGKRLVFLSAEDNEARAGHQLEKIFADIAELGTNPGARPRLKNYRT